MKHLAFSSLTLSCLMALASGCAFELDRNATRGDEGRTEWNLDDGLCRNLWGCDLSAPLVAGATSELSIYLEDGDVRGYDVRLEGPATVAGPLDATMEVLRVPVRADGPGEVTAVLLDRDDEEVDRARFTIVEAAAMRCARLESERSVHYSMDTLTEDTAVALVVPAPEDEPPPTQQLGCLVTDAGDRPALSADAIEWEVVEGAEVVGVDASGFLTLAGSTTRGARIYLTPRVAGEATLVARLGELEQTITVTVTE